jgi:gas vesicle protein
MSRDEGAGGSAVLVAFLLGAVTGAVVALLWAPTSGEETRRLVVEKAREGRDQAAQAVERGREFIERQRGTVASAIERGREAYRQARGESTEPESV